QDELTSDLVVTVGDAKEDAGVCPGESRWGLTRMLECLPDHFQQHALLRIHYGSFARGDLEKGWVEILDVLDETAVAGVHLARRAWIRIVKRVDVPAIRRDFRDYVLFAKKKIPEGVGTMDVSRKSASDPD